MKKFKWRRFKKSTRIDNQISNLQLEKVTTDYRSLLFVVITNVNVFVLFKGV